ncbi:Pick C1-like protein 1 [Seminavis robusta]|uniref:Pick C1-like protein 1 n=1 Tax=Seminavis robusta TaxID=568900 RepID=A0A9N8HJ51_9STRA|nr:Pick C1-like protein 1 [Seminavis robusta]|eukprot:Sro535_g161970.1 Pick C1-like protein 1 (989) ;mRNA; f:35527-38879
MDGTRVTSSLERSAPAPLQDEAEVPLDSSNLVAPSVSSIVSMVRNQEAAAEEEQQQQEGPILVQWTQFTSTIHRGISHAVVKLSCLAARNPKTVVALVCFLSVALPLLGLLTNLQIEVEQEAIISPFNSLSRKHSDWIQEQAGFPQPTRPFDLLVHRNGDTVLDVNTMRKVFEALEIFQATPGYAKICASSDYEIPNTGQRTCRINAATRFWWHNSTLFEEQVKSEADLIRILSADEYPLGTPVGDHDFILGNYQMMMQAEQPEQKKNSTVTTTTTNVLTSAQSYIIRIDVPVVEGRSPFAFEDAVTEVLIDIRQAWDEDESHKIHLEFFTFRSIHKEFTRAIANDLPLYPAVFFIMCGFACLTFYRKDRVRSRCLLGIGAVVTVLLSLMSGMGLLFVIGVPLTNLTGSLAFVVFGVGLDDTFIIMGHYNRTDPRKSPVERVEETMEVVGLSIFVTTVTTMMAFGLGTLSAVPAINWLCWYAWPTILIDFLYQITFYIALVILDEERIMANRRDCLVCITVPPRKQMDTQKSAPSEEEKEEECDELEPDSLSGQDEEEEVAQTGKTYQERFMESYAKFLLRPKVKIAVIAAFLIYFGIALYFATLLEQEFKPQEIVPGDSYVKGFLNGVNQYSKQVIIVGAYFRNVDQSNSTTQDSMREYIEKLGNLSQINEQPPFCWVRDFQEIQKNYAAMAETLQELPFSEQLDFALSIPAIKEVYGSDIVVDAESGNITASRCWLFMKHLDLQDVEEQTKMLLDQRRLSRDQLENQGTSEFAFFSFDIWYIIWEFYNVALNELILTTIGGIVAVSIVAFFFIPHWTAVLFVSPLITTLYIDLLGTLSMAGVSVNVVTYVCLVISVGLLVDFLMHMLLKYYESHERTREEKVRDTLVTMGPSILVGGLSTCLGVVPLAFSGNDVNKVVFTSFFAMVTLGFVHGLIFLPVILSMVGPTNTRSRQLKTAEKEVEKSSDDEAVVERELSMAFSVGSISV